MVGTTRNTAGMAAKRAGALGRIGATWSRTEIVQGAKRGVVVVLLCLPGRQRPACGAVDRCQCGPYRTVTHELPLPYDRLPCHVRPGCWRPSIIPSRRRAGAILG